MVIGLTGACGKINLMLESEGKFNCGTIFSKSWPSAPRPCSQMTVERAGNGGSSSILSSRFILIEVACSQENVGFNNSLS